MKEKLRRGLILLVVLLLCVLFARALLVYSRPMEDVTLDLSLIDKSDAAAPEVFDEKGWEVYTREAEKVTHLEHNGRGFYLGIELGQTLYLSRVMEEALDNPTLQIGTADRTFTVWLDDEVIYTDWPDTEQRAGYLRLPMNGSVRQEPISITLPQNYRGKTLTIAQSTPEWSETPKVMAAPASVVLYCGYAYESGIIAQSYSLAIAAFLLFSAGVFLLILFLRRKDWNLLFISLTAFLGMCILLNDAPFRYRYFGADKNLHWNLRWFTALTMMVFLTLKAGKHRKLLLGLLWACVAATPVSFILYSFYGSSILVWPSFLFHTLPEALFLIFLVASLVPGMLHWRKETRFWRLYAPLTLAGLLLYWAAVLISDPGALRSLYVGLQSGSTYQLYFGCLNVSAVTAMASALWDALRAELELRTDKRLIEQHREHALASYENMYRQHEEVMMLRHDMNKHFLALQELTEEPSVRSYLEELIGQNKKIRPVIQSGNSILDIILNSKLGAAADAGIPVEVLRSEAPQSLPLSDADLCSLIMNILDNAIAAAAKASQPGIRLDIHVKSNYLTFICENTMQDSDLPREEEETVPKHGFGLKIIRSITERYSGLVDMEYSKDSCRVRVALPLH